METEESRVSMEIDLDNVETRVLDDNDNDTEVGFGGSVKSGSDEGSTEMEICDESRVYEVKSERPEGDIGRGSGGVGSEDSEIEKAGDLRVEETRVSSEITSRYGLEAGDMVWGKVKSHPWWPGHIFNGAFVASSVRRTRREGSVLVAFFGDSSYGWFDDSELIPFEPNFAEKSLQTNSRIFVKAVEEAIGEASRRSALGLACRCRNPSNFQPTKVEGFLSVDVSGYELGGIYSDKQIKTARDNFHPTEAISFARQLALMPLEHEKTSLDWFKNKAVLLAYRKAIFEEFDETYAQAFGMQPEHLTHHMAGSSKQPTKEKSRAPFSGRMVIAETLGDKKSSTKQMKVKDKSKKDKYVFKRRDEPHDSITHHVSTTRTDFGSTSSSREEVLAMASGDYVLQKRTPPISTEVQLELKVEGSETSEGGDGTPTHVGTVDEVKPFDISLIDPHAAIPDRSFLAGHKVNGSMKSAGGAGPTCTSLADGFEEYLQREGRGMVFSGQDGNAELSSGARSMEPAKLSVEHHREQDHVLGVGVPPLPIDGVVKKAKKDRTVKKLKKDRVVMKTKVLKQRKEDLNLEKSITGEKRKKKKKESGGLESNLEHPNKRLKTVKQGESARKFAGKSIGIGLVSKDYSQVEAVRKEIAASGIHSLSESSPSLSSFDLGNIELPQLVNDLLALASDPFHGADRNSAAIVRHVLLRFRSLVYQKSLVIIPPSEADTSEISVGKSPLRSEEFSDFPLKPNTHLTRPDDPTRSGRKRGHSDRQEEKSAKRTKKVNEIKSMAAEKKKIIEVQQAEPKKINKQPSFLKKLESSKVVDDPAMLVMKFPPRVALPSIQELKARFGRFGPLDHSATRAFWKSSTCRVVFRHLSDARVAYQYAMRSDGLFGNVKVNYQVKEVGGPEVSENTKSTDARALPKSTSLQQQPHQRAGQLKSCLKKPAGEEARPKVGITKETPRVKFMLGGEKTVSSNNNNNNNNNMDFNNGGSSSSSFAMDVNNSKNIRKVIPSSLPALLPLPPGITPRNLDSRSHGAGQSSPFSKLNTHYNEVLEPRNNNSNLSTTVASPSVTASVAHVDISHKMLSLLIRCNDIVSNVQRSLGYASYQPL